MDANVLKDEAAERPCAQQSEELARLFCAPGTRRLMRYLNLEHGPALGSIARGDCPPCSSTTRRATVSPRPTPRVFVV